MNRSRSAIVQVCLAAAITGAVTMLWRAPMSHAPSAAAGLEAGSARARQELMMLRDPATGRIPEGIRARELAFAATLPTRETQPLMLKGARLDAVWRNRGPWNIGGRTRALALDVAGEDTILAAGVSGGIWRSSNGGEDWQRVTLPTQLPAVTCIVQDTRRGRTATWYAGTGELLGNSASGGRAYYFGDGMLKSTDNGRTWARLAATSSGTPHIFDRIYDNVWRLAIDASDTTRDEVYAAIYGTIARSTDGGTSWRTSLGGLQQTPTGGSYSGYYTEVATTSTGVVYATISADGWKKGIWRSDDGVTWTLIAPTDMPAQYNRISIGIAPGEENTVYFLAETPGTGALGRNFRGDSSWHHLWRYTWIAGTGAGENGRWENLTDRLPMFGPPHGDFFSQGSYDLFVRVDPADARRVYLGGTNLYRTADAFASREGVRWIGGYQNLPFDSTAYVELEYPNHHPDLHELVFSRRSPGTIYSGSDGGVHRLDDPGADSVSWAPLNFGYLTTQHYTIAINHARSGDAMVVGGMQDNGTWLTTSDDPTAAWRVVGSGDGAYCALDGNGSLYVSKQLGRVYRLVLDGDGSAIAETRIDPAGRYQSDYLFISPFVLDASSPTVMYLASGAQLWRNSDLTAIPMASRQPATTGWSMISGTSVPDSLFITAVSSSTVAPSHRVYIGTSIGKVLRIDDATGAAPTPVDVSSSTFPANGYVSCIAVDPLNGDHAIAVFSNYSVQSLFATTDAGATWTAVSGNLEQNANGTGAGPSCRWATILHRPNGTVYLVGTSVGLFSTTTLAGMGTGWTQEGASSIGNVVVGMVQARQSDGFIAAATHGYGVWTATMAVARVDATQASSDAVVASIAPNPVTASTRVALRIPDAAAGTRLLLRVFDPVGREIATVHDAPATPGSHSVPLDGRRLGLRAGRYFLRVECGPIVETHSLEVVRY